MNVKNDIDLRIVHVLRYPEDKAFIATLSLEEKIMWYSGQSPRHMVYLGNEPTFKRFWFWTYIVPLRIKRFMYKIKAGLRI